MKSVISMIMMAIVVILMVFFAISMNGCATIPQDKPETVNQCFEGKFNPFRMNQETWKVKMRYKSILFLKNPTIGELPDYVAIDVFNRSITSYAYLDGRKVVIFGLNHKKRCYLQGKFAPGMDVVIKKLLLKCRNGYEV